MAADVAQLKRSNNKYYFFFIDNINRRHKGWEMRKWEDKTHNTSTYKRV